MFGGLLTRVALGAADYVDVGFQFCAALLGASAYMQLNRNVLKWQLQANLWRQARAQGIYRLGEVSVYTYVPLIIN